MNIQTIVDDDGLVSYAENYLEPDEAQNLFQSLMQKLAWRQESYTIYGKSVLAPRLVAWYGDANAVYTYSGIRHQPLPWNRELLEIRDRIGASCQREFNSVLANLYRTGADSMGWHADQEPELGPNPFIASLSLGETRTFKLRHRQSKRVVKLELTSGSLLLMGGELQHHWQHCVPKTVLDKTARINLTFRLVHGN